MSNEPFTPNEVKIAVIGGGTGSFTLLRSLKRHTTQLAALVNMADDGGSTGMLRDELGVLPPGDVRQCLVALSGTPELRDLFNYRFEDGSLKGHAFGNLFLTALEKMSGSFVDGVELASRLLDITGTVEPITTENVTLMMKDITTGEIVRGEGSIGDAQFAHQRPELWLEPAANATSRALRAIETADMVVIAPGNLYGSLAPALLVAGVGDALRSTGAKVVYVSNLMTKQGQTDNFSVSDFATEIERMAGGPCLDAVVYNTAAPDEALIEKYAGEGERPVRADEQQLEEAPYVAVGADVLARALWQNTNKKADPLAATRSLIRHDSAKIARVLLELHAQLEA